MSYTWALQKAVDLDCNLFITHEPTFYHPRDQVGTLLNLPGIADKRKYIQDQELVILRCHDLWDQMPEIGIADSWGELLGLGPAIAGEGYFRVYDVSGRTALEVARQVAERCRQFGQEAVQLVGPGDRRVTRVVTGTGAITPVFQSITEYPVDLVICSDDGITYWKDAAYAIDMGLPLIVVNHAVSEEAGLMNLATYLQGVFPDIPVHYLPQRCMYRLINGS